MKIGHLQIAFALVLSCIFTSSILLSSHHVAATQSSNPEWTIPVVDPYPVITGEVAEISLNVTHPTGIFIVYFEIEDDNHTMLVIGDTYIYLWTATEVGIHFFEIYMASNNGTWSRTGGSILVVDDNPLTTPAGTTSPTTPPPPSEGMIALWAIGIGIVILIPTAFLAMRREMRKRD
ncbi:MAG: hypothetical protein JSW61_02945 [Candidatus Thorarchaeota archaeon]|nr:MAG: hypothetical protein JSW61_02945 [Candidatus Thorarchaeota archaeon]